MKVLGINSSFRKNGNTENIIQFLGESLRESALLNNADLEIEYINLSELTLSTCRGCRVCFDYGEERCPIQDRFQELREKLLLADGIILGSPVYVEDVNGIMKNWIDRMAYYCHRPAFFGKTALVITTSGAGSSNHAINTMKNALRSWGFSIEGHYKFPMGAKMERKIIEERYMSQVNGLVHDYYTHLTHNQPFNPSFYGYLIFKVQQTYWRKNKRMNHTCDYRYWEEKGWLKPQCEYYIQHKNTWVKRKAARLLGSVVSKFFT